MRRWSRPEPVELPEALVAAVGSRPLAELLYRRGWTSPDAALTFLTGGIDVDAPGLPDLDTGVQHLLSALQSGRRICVYGDYDTDGVTATALLVGLLRSLGADVTYHIPNRFREGYGMNAKVVEAIAAEGAGLILTCDCGIRNLAEVALARSLGLQVVVTDHHELGPDLPVAEAVINPKRLPEDHPCRMLPGVGTAYLVARQMLRALGRDPAGADQWLDLVAVGIIADVVPLTGANRELGRRGLARLNTSPCVGLEALRLASGLNGLLTEEEVAFQLVPRLNAAGRLADASLCVQLLLCDEVSEARALATQLDQLNQERKRLTATVTEAAAAEVSLKAGAILLYHAEWHEGVLGIAAGRLAEEHGVPTLLMARKHGTQTLVGSARAPEGFVLHEALEACGEHLLKHGGHAAAAGFSLLEERFPAFRAAMLEEVRRRARTGVDAGATPADLALPLAQVDRKLYDDLRRASPFGESNPGPVLFSEGVKLLSSRPIGAGDKHLRLVLRDGEQSLTGLWWGAGPDPVQPQALNLFYRLGLNQWNGEEMVQVLVEHVEDYTTARSKPGPVVQLGPDAHPARADLLDRRGKESVALIGEFPEAMLFAEGLSLLTPNTIDRYGLRDTPELILLTPPPSPRLLDEALSRSGAKRVVLAWSIAAPTDEDRFLPTLMRLIAGALEEGPYASVSRLAIATGELETVVHLGLRALEQSDLLAIDEEVADRIRLRRRTDGRGISESHQLQELRRLLGESRAFRRFLRTASLAAITRTIYAP